MIKSLVIQNFKNFRDASLRMGSFTVLIGANASGKSNVRDAFLFLNGIGRGYSLVEILGDKYVGGARIWNGIRGGIRESAYMGLREFSLGLTTEQSIHGRGSIAVDYRIRVKLEDSITRPLRVEAESLKAGGRLIFQANAGGAPDYPLGVVFPSQSGHEEHLPLIESQDSRAAALGNAWIELPHGSEESEIAFDAHHSLEGLRFLDFSPAQMCLPSLPGQTTLGDSGENLSSVLAAICEDPAQENTLLEWIRKLTPMDVVGLGFDQDAAGRIVLRLKETNGGTISAMSASDGTVRFLGLLAAVFGPKPASFYFIEELENGIHPTRLSLLVDLIESQAKRRGIQIVATSHSPQLLQFLNDESLEHASLVYRLPDRPDGRIKRIVDIPEARRVIKEQPMWMLHASSWFEDVLDLTEDADAEPVAGNQPAS